MRGREALARPAGGRDVGEDRRASAARTTTALGIDSASDGLKLDATTLLVAQYAAAGVSFAGTLLAAWLAGAEAYGRAALAIAFPALVWSVVGIKSGSVTTRYFARALATSDHTTTSAMYRLGIGLDFGLAVLALAVVAGSALLLGGAALAMEPDLLPLAVLFAATIPLSSLTNTSLAYLSSSRRFGEIAVLQLADKVVAVALVALLVPAGFAATGIVLAIGGGQAIAGVLGLWRSMRAMRSDGVAPWAGSLADLAGLRSELRSAFAWSYVASTTGGVLANVPLLALGWHGAAVEAGYCRLALSIMNVSSYLEAALARAVYPRLAGRTNRLDGAELTAMSLRAGMPAGLVLLVAAAALPYVVGATLGAQFAPMVPGALMMMAAVALGTCVFWVPPFLQARGRFRAWGLGNAVAAALVAVLAWPAVESWGYLGAAAVVAIGRLAPFAIGLATALRSPESVG